jgi:hypothetical protein
MKTLRLTRAESAAYTNGERRFWRACGGGNDGGAMPPPLSPEQQAALGLHCPYGQPGDLVKLSGGEVVEGVFMITAITVELRNGRWGWVVEVGA